MRGAGALGAILVVALSACTPAEFGCTAIGSPSGLGVTVTEQAAVGLTGLTLRVCQGGQCADHRVTLVPGVTTTDEGCTGSDPDSSCAASAVPDHTLTAFLDLPKLVPGPFTVSGRANRGKKSVPLTTVKLDAVVTYPNGRECGADGNQAQVTLDPNGLS